jgi:aspartyl protease family protein
MGAWIALSVLIMSGFVLIGRHDTFIIAGMNAADLAMVASGALLTVWLSGTLLLQIREAHPRAARRLAKSGLALAVLGLAAWFQAPLGDFGRMAWTAWGGALPLPRAISEAVAGWTRQQDKTPEAEAGEKAVRIRIRADGHYYARAQINGVSATLLVDSGAATVVLKAADARDAGVDLDALSFTIPMQTAHGPAYAAGVRLRQLRVGVIVIPDVEVLVVQPGRLETSLLGMSFLSRLRSYEFSGEFLTFRG